MNEGNKKKVDKLVGYSQLVMRQLVLCQNAIQSDDVLFTTNVGMLHAITTPYHDEEYKKNIDKKRTGLNALEKKYKVAPKHLKPDSSTVTLDMSLFMFQELMGLLDRQGFLTDKEGSEGFSSLL